jgi:RNA polymerase sigma-70 factor (ECF subfamily)
MVAHLPEAELNALIEAARAAWPDVHVTRNDFEKALASHGEGAPTAAVAKETWLAAACANGDPKALRAFEAHTFPGARAVLGRMGLSRDAVAEVLQILREKMLLGDAGQAPRVLAAAAHGDLPGVIRVAAARTALNLRRRDHRLEHGDAPLVHQLCPDDDPELTALKEQHRAAFKTALEDALQSLTPQDRNILRMHLIHGLSIDAIGTSYQVHRATAARWLSAIRERLDQETRRLLSERRGLSEPEINSLVRLVESRIDVSFRRVLESKHV